MCYNINKINGNPHKSGLSLYIIRSFLSGAKRQNDYFLLSLTLMTSIINIENAIIKEIHSYVLIIESPPPL